jgi:hypothetical protein
VLGLARDGGYYLVGLHRRAAPHLGALFDGIPWSTPRVLTRTIAIAQERGLAFELLDTLDDIDRPEDLRALHDIVSGKGRGEKISVIIPTLNEGSHIARTLSALMSGTRIDIIVADSASHDRTRELASLFGVKVIETPRTSGDAAASRICRRWKTTS